MMRLLLIFGDYGLFIIWVRLWILVTTSDCGRCCFFDRGLVARWERRGVWIAHFTLFVKASIYLNVSHPAGLLHLFVIHSKLFGVLLGSTVIMRFGTVADVALGGLILLRTQWCSSHPGPDIQIKSTISFIFWNLRHHLGATSIHVKRQYLFSLILRLPLAMLRQLDHIVRLVYLNWFLHFLVIIVVIVQLGVVRWIY